VYQNGTQRSHKRVPLKEAFYSTLGAKDEKTPHFTQKYALLTQGVFSLVKSAL